MSELNLLALEALADDEPELKRLLDIYYDIRKSISGRMFRRDNLMQQVDEGVKVIDELLDTQASVTGRLRERLED